MPILYSSPDSVDACATQLGHQSKLTSALLSGMSATELSRTSSLLWAIAKECSPSVRSNIQRKGGQGLRMSLQSLSAAVLSLYEFRAVCMYKYIIYISQYIYNIYTCPYLCDAT